MKRKEFPFPALLLLGILLVNFLVGDDGNLGGMLFIFGLFLVIWTFLGPDLEPPSDPAERFRQIVRRREEIKRPQDPQGLLLEVQMRAWSARFYEDRAFRSKALALGLGLMLAGTAALTWLDEGVILWRAVLLMGMCVSGLLILFAYWLWHRLRQQKEKGDRAAFPAPQVNMNYDYDAAADARVRALHQRLDRLEEWKRSGLIDGKEYEELRNKYLNQKKERE